MKIHLRMIGCRLNQAEIDTMARQFQQQGHEIVSGAEQADQVIVNTCVVTRNAAKDSRKLIRELHRANVEAEITATGCYAQVSPDELVGLPGVVRVVDNTGKDTLVTQLTGVPVERFDHEPVAREQSHPGAAGRTRAFVKAQDGCDNQCTFCITTVARGDGRSLSIEAILDEIRYLHRTGFQEVVLTGVHLGSYGHDKGANTDLTQLMRAILSDTDIPRLRLSSLEPWDLSPDFFDLWKDPRVCRHLHLPLQSGCDATLKRMRRHTNQAEFRRLVQAVRERIPDISITTDVIVGFPGETDDEFAISAAFIEEMAFSRMHIFRYSKRDGTPAARMKNQVEEAVKKTRSAHLHALAGTMAQQFAERFDGQTRTVLWEQVVGSTEAGFINVGYTDNYIRVRGVHPRVLTNHITPAQMLLYDAARGQMTAKPLLI
jgi:threonylcarbamoyladenosine tRNA methylthiotransferase MtaB